MRGFLFLRQIIDRLQLTNSICPSLQACWNLACLSWRGLSRNPVYRAWKWKSKLAFHSKALWALLDWRFQSCSFNNASTPYPIDKWKSYQNWKTNSNLFFKLLLPSESEFFFPYFFYSPSKKREGRTSDDVYYNYNVWILLSHENLSYFRLSTPRELWFCVSQLMF